MATTRRAVVVFDTTGTRFQVPPGHLNSGGDYVIRLSAVYVGAELQSLEAVVTSFTRDSDLLAAAGDGTAPSMRLPVIQTDLDQLSTISPGTAGAIMVDSAGIVVAASPHRVLDAVGQRLRSLRQQRRLSLASLSAMTGVSASTTRLRPPFLAW